jgi:hypothetical protein
MVGIDLGIAKSGSGRCQCWPSLRTSGSLRKGAITWAAPAPIRPHLINPSKINDSCPCAERNFTIISRAPSVSLTACGGRLDANACQTWHFLEIFDTLFVFMLEVYRWKNAKN